MFRNILVPTDGSALSRKAVKSAVRLAREQRARITAVYVSPPYTPRAGQGMAMVHFESPQAYAARAGAVARRYLGFVQKAASAARVRCEAVHASGDFPYQEILAAAGRRKCDLICMASHGRRGMSRVILGSETSKVLAHSRIPVLITR